MALRCCLFAVVDRGGVVDSVVGGVVDDWDGVSYVRDVLLLAGLGVQGQGDLLTAGLSDHNLLLLNGVGGIHKLGNVEVLVFGLVVTHDFDEGDVDDACPLGAKSATW